MRFKKMTACVLSCLMILGGSGAYTLCEAPETVMAASSPYFVEREGYQEYYAWNAGGETWGSAARGVTMFADFTLYGDAGSSAEDYAILNDIGFKEISPRTIEEQPTAPSSSVSSNPSSSNSFGDINGDGMVNASDTALILIYAVAV